MSEYPTSYFSAPSRQLDPKLFEGRVLKSWARQGIQSLLNDFLNLKYRHGELWAHAWLAGSGVSYQWEASREPGDLDCLVGVNYVQFRKANPEFSGLNDREISEQLNEEFRDELQGQTENWNGYELTFYVNPGATDIRVIKPYAAYDLKYNEWTVAPDPNVTPPANAEWDRVAQVDREKTRQVSTRFNQALQDIRTSPNSPLRRNAETRLGEAAAQGSALFDEIHENRSQAFSQVGEGYKDFHNYRWQAGKKLGTIQELRRIREHVKQARVSTDVNTYGVELPDTRTLIRRAALYRNQ